MKRIILIFTFNTLHCLFAQDNSMSFETTSFLEEKIKPLLSRRKSLPQNSLPFNCFSVNMNLSATTYFDVWSTSFLVKSGAYSENIVIGPQKGPNLLFQSSSQSQLYSAFSYGRYRRISSMNTSPSPPAVGLSLLPKPMVIELTLLRLIPWSANSCRSIAQRVHSSSKTAFGSSL
jgi:hypothetical protein